MSPAPLSRETRLLLLTAAEPRNDAAMRRLLQGAVDWDELCFLAQHEKASSVVVQELGRLGASAVASGFRDLRQLATLSVMQMLQLEQLLHQTLDILRDHGIDVMALKGAALGYTAYRSFADRPMTDLDVLVQPGDAQAVWSLLQARGWTWPSDRFYLGRYTEHHHLPPLLREPGGFRLEIHTDLLPGGHPFRFSVDSVWARAESVRLNQRVLKVPDLVHQLWHVCVHFAWQHELRWGAWRALRDVATIVGQGNVAWPEFVTLAEETRARTCCYWTLRLASRVAGAAVPEGVLDALRPPRPRFLLDELERHYVSNLFPSAHRCPSVALARRLWTAGFLPGWSGHGRMRPWHVLERWEAASPPREVERAPRSPGSRARQIAATATYLLRTHRLGVPLSTQ